MVPKGLGMKAQMMRGAAWVAASRVLINGIGFASTLLLARLLSPDDFGVVALALTFIAIVGSVTEIPLSTALIQHTEPERAHFDSAWTLSMLRGAILGIVLALAAVPLARLYGDARLVPLIWVLAVLTFIQSLASPMVVKFTRRLDFKQDFIVGVAKKLSGFVFALFIAWTYQSYWALIVGQAASEIITVIVTYILAPYRPRVTLSHARELLGFSVWLSLVQVIQTLNYRFDNLFIGYFLSSADVGQYSYGTNLALLPTREATAPIAQTLFPAFSLVRHDRERLRGAYTRAQTLLCAIALPIGIGFAAIADPLVHILLGDKWAPAVLVIQVLSSIFALQTLASSLHPLAMAIGETKALFRRDVANLAVRLPLVVGGLFVGGFAGIVFARIGSGLASIFMNMALVKRFTGLSIAAQLAANKRGLAASAAMVAGIVLFQKLVPTPSTLWAGCVFLGAQIAIGGAAYVLFCYAAWVAERRPDGPEAEVFAMARGALRRLNGLQRNNNSL
jgi:O-antigen/teichoic acid export membrane protein